MNWANIGETALRGILEPEEINRAGALKLQWENGWWERLNKVHSDLIRYSPKTSGERQLKERLLAEVVRAQSSI